MGIPSSEITNFETKYDYLKKMKFIFMSPRSLKQLCLVMNIQRGLAIRNYLVDMEGLLIAYTAYQNQLKHQTEIALAKQTIGNGAMNTKNQPNKVRTVLQFSGGRPSLFYSRQVAKIMQRYTGKLECDEVTEAVEAAQHYSRAAVCVEKSMTEKNYSMHLHDKAMFNAMAAFYQQQQVEAREAAREATRALDGANDLNAPPLKKRQITNQNGGISTHPLYGQKGMIPTSVANGAPPPNTGGTLRLLDDTELNLEDYTGPKSPQYPGPTTIASYLHTPQHRAPEADDESVEDGIFLMKLYGSNSVRFEEDGEKEYFICSGQKKRRNKEKKRMKKKYVDSVVLYECPVQRSINVRRVFHMFVAQNDEFLPQKNINERKFGVRTSRANDLVEVIERIKNELYYVEY